ncbi:MAG TPA: uroporphyrinogen decarboxylase family protein [bacterium]|nr:uroporphyrinogen decarboxylase family protein [bacterium]HPG45668.1 uroporphyrinogen decarboxylase family protein [bacterium]HPM97553.1 uroporphyrinogen decarboxylase family protein [bacterium]
MTRRERLLATLAGKPVDRPPVCFYELNGLDEDPKSKDPYHIFTHPSWLPLIELTQNRSDRIVMRSPTFVRSTPDPIEEATTLSVQETDSYRLSRRQICIGKRCLSALTRQDRDLNTLWHIERLLKNRSDALLWLELPADEAECVAQTSPILTTEQTLGDSGIVMLDTPDPLCLAAELFDFADYVVFAVEETQLFHRLLERVAEPTYRQVEAACLALPGRLWRIYGPEYAGAPYLPPALFHDFVCRYDHRIIETIQRSGGYARIHAHGRLQGILPHLEELQIDALDPIEPPPQGDIELSTVRRRYGDRWVLFGNIEISDLENQDQIEFHRTVQRSLQEGLCCPGKGFVLMPSACPYGRELSANTLANYNLLIECAENF